MKIALILFSLIVALVGVVFVSIVVSEDGGVGIGLWMTTWGGVGLVVASIWGSVQWNSAIQR